MLRPAPVRYGPRVALSFPRANDETEFLAEEWPARQG